MNTSKSWFQVDKEGLAAILQRRGVEFAVFELVSNAFDTGATHITVSLEAVPGKAYVLLSVQDDDPHGFTDLTHAFTLFAPSEKKGKADKRGRFNLGEKLVLAICTGASICSTTGTVLFDKDGRHDLPRRKRAQGSEFVGSIRMTRDEMSQTIAALHTLLVPKNVQLTVNGQVILSRVPIATHSATLATEIADAEGNLKRARAMTEFRIYEPLDGEVGTLYELGIPVVETGDRFHVDVQQKVPLNMDRDNVPPAFLRELRGHVLNATSNWISTADSTQSWVTEAIEQSHCSDVTIETVLDRRFGEKRVAYDPSDPEANKLAVAAGYTVVHGGSLSAQAWHNARQAGAIVPAGRVTPSPKPFSPDGEELVLLPMSEWPDAVLRISMYAKDLAPKLLGARIAVFVTNTPEWPFSATYGNCRLILNIGKFDFSGGVDEKLDALLLHEFSHHFCSDHLSRDFAEAGFRLGAKLKWLALEDPEFFRSFFEKM